jgi:hypothetical protein
VKEGETTDANESGTISRAAGSPWLPDPGSSEPTPVGSEQELTTSSPTKKRAKKNRRSIIDAER